jgi:hypothetical protein
MPFQWAWWRRQSSCILPLSNVFTCYQNVTRANILERTKCQFLHNSTQLQHQWEPRELQGKARTIIAWGKSDFSPLTLTSWDDGQKGIFCFEFQFPSLYVYCSTHAFSILSCISDVREKQIHKKLSNFGNLQFSLLGDYLNFAGKCCLHLQGTGGELNTRLNYYNFGSYRFWGYFAVCVQLYCKCFTVLHLVVAILHYMFRPTWPSSSVLMFYFHIAEEICFAVFCLFFHVVILCAFPFVFFCCVFFR